MRSMLLHSSMLALSLAGPLAVRPCPWCGAGEAPASTGWSSRIAPAGERGTPVEITGTVYQPDGRTPVAGVLVYAWQPNGRGAFRGWARTDAGGRYRFVTFRPETSAVSGEAPEVHLTVTPPGGGEVPVAPVVLRGDASHAPGGQHVVRDISLQRGT